jgi:hypothetical protein
LVANRSYGTAFGPRRRFRRQTSSLRPFIGHQSKVCPAHSPSGRPEL